MSRTGWTAAPVPDARSSIVCAVMSVAPTEATGPAAGEVATPAAEVATGELLVVRAGGRVGRRRGDHDLLAGLEPGLDLDEAAAGDADLDLPVLVLPVDLHLHRALPAGGTQRGARNA